MKAIFLGQDSMGFVHGQTYDLTSNIKQVHVGGYIFGEEKTCICLYDRNSRAWCPYSSLEKIFENWRFIDIYPVQ